MKYPPSLGNDDVAQISCSKQNTKPAKQRRDGKQIEEAVANFLTAEAQVLVRKSPEPVAVQETESTPQKVASALPARFRKSAADEGVLPSPNTLSKVMSPGTQDVLKGALLGAKLKSVVSTGTLSMLR